MKKFPSYSGWNLNLNYATKNKTIGFLPLFSIRKTNY